MESIFLSHHFDDEIEPVVKSFTRLIESHDLQVIDGHRLLGDFVEDVIRKRIKDSDAVVVFLSKREQGKTNDWVKSERATARALGIPLIAVVENGLDVAGPFTGFETIPYDPANLSETLLAISETIFGWKLQLGEQIEAVLEPDDIVTTVRDNVQKKDIVQYRLLKRRGQWSDWQDAFVMPKAGGVSLRLEGVSKNSEIQIRVSTNNRIWNSDVVNRNLRILVS